MAEQLGMQDHNSNITQALVILYMGYTHIQGRLGHFSRLVDSYPKLLEDRNRDQLLKTEGEMVIYRLQILKTIFLVAVMW